MPGLQGKITDLGGQGNIKKAYVNLAPGADQVVVAAATGKAYQVTAVEISADIAGKIQLHFGAVAGIATKAIAGGWFAVDGGRTLGFGFSGPEGAAGEAINATVTTVTNAIIIVHYLERAS